MGREEAEKGLEWSSHTVLQLAQASFLRRELVNTTYPDNEFYRAGSCDFTQFKLDVID